MNRNTKSRKGEKHTEIYTKGEMKENVQNSREREREKKH